MLDGPIRNRLSTNFLAIYAKERGPASTTRLSDTRFKSRGPFTTFLFVVSLYLCSCAETRYVNHQDAGDETNLHSRTVVFSIAPEFYLEFPTCAVVMPPSGEKTTPIFSKLIEESFSHRISGKLSRVVNATQRNLSARRLAFDLAHAADRLALAEALDCDTIAVVELTGAGRSFMLVWSEVRIGLDVRLIRVRDERVLWRARHVADRSAGGIPLSPLGIAAEAFSSFQFSADQEVWLSVLDDAVRRIVSTLPDVRSFASMR